MNGKRHAILIVEDNHREQIIIRTVFEDLGVKVPIYTVQDGVEAVEFLKGRGKFANRDEFHFPTFLLTDIKMPRMDGLELLMYIKRSSLSIIPTIVFSNSSDLDDIKQAYLLGANAYHIKATTLEKFREQLRMLYQYWTCVDFPGVDDSGHLLPTKSGGRFGMRHPITLDHPSEGNED